MCTRANLQICKCANVHMRKCANKQMCICAYVHICKLAKVQMCKCANVQMCKSLLEFDDARLDPRAIPIARQITLTSASLDLNARVEGPGKTPAELSQLRDSEIRHSNPDPLQIWTLLAFSVIGDDATIMAYTCDCTIDSATKSMQQGLSLQNKFPKVVRLVGDVTVNETHQKFN